MKISEAILAGCALSAPIRGKLYEETPDGQVRTCALGAAVLGICGQLPKRGLLRPLPSQRTLYAACLGLEAAPDTAYTSNLADVAPPELVELWEAETPYRNRYGFGPGHEFDYGVFTREEIAARFAAIGL